jgi:hypothetical protein
VCEDSRWEAPGTARSADVAELPGSSHLPSDLQGIAPPLSSRTCIGCHLCGEVLTGEWDVGGGGPHARVYHRRESTTQTPDVAIQQEASGELWGYPAQYGDIPKVKAFGGPLPDGVRGIEFTTEVEPDRGGHPRQPTWSGDRDGVVAVPGERAVKIRIVVTKNTQR